MKKGIVCYYKSRNIGDEVQSIAAKNLLKDKVEYLDRENLHTYSSEEKVKLLCNGWFMHEPVNWPPSDDIDPYFISFHIAKFKSVREEMLTDKNIEYYKKVSPIGCRDFSTLRELQSRGVDAYYSGCMTLTLPEYKGERKDNIVIADLFYDGILEEDYANRVVHKLIPEEYHHKLEFTTHTREDADMPVEEKMNEAQNLLDIYANAGLVITSRIHCALPCLAMGTPVLFFDFGYAKKRDKLRFEGIINLFNTVRPKLPMHENRTIDKILKGIGLHKLFYPFIKPLDIDWDNPPKNKDDYKQIAEKIKASVAKEFG